MKPIHGNWVRHVCLKYKSIYFSEPVLYSVKHSKDLRLFNLRMTGGVSPHLITEAFVLGEGRSSGKRSLGLVWENEDEKNSSSLVFWQKEEEQVVLTLKPCSKLSQLLWFQVGKMSSHRPNKHAMVQ